LRLRTAGIVLLGALCGAACRKSPESGVPASARPAPKGDVVWLVDPLGAGQEGLEPELQRLGVAALFLPGGEIRPEAGRWSLQPDAPPPRAFERVPVVLVLRAGEALATALTGPGTPEAGAIAAAVAPGLSATIRGGTYGRAIGVHLDFPFAPGGAAAYAQLVAALQRGLPPGVFVSISLRSLPASEEDRQRLDPLFASADALVAFVFGAGARVDPAAADGLRRPWWAGYDTTATGVVTGVGGEARPPVPGKYLDALSGNPRLEFENDLTVNDASVAAFKLTARAPVRVGGVALEAGDQVAFHLPAIGEMLFQMGSNLAGKRFALGRAVVFDGASEADRVFSLAAFEDVLLGRPLAPALEARVSPAGRNAVVVELANRSHHASVVSRTANWIEVDLSPARAADVQIGGFDRYEVYDASGRPVTPGRATHVRLFETLVAPMETITPARIVVRGGLPAACCRYRLHAGAEAGPEVATDWSVAPPPPLTPAPKKAPRRK
jgi:hypothetical protein